MENNGAGTEPTITILIQLQFQLYTNNQFETSSTIIINIADDKTYVFNSFINNTITIYFIDFQLITYYVYKY